jgi:predicted transcriptional regulator
MTYMAKTLTVRLDDQRISALDNVAAGIDRDRSYVVTQAIDAYLETQAWQIAYIEAALREAEAGKFATEQEVNRTFELLRGKRKRKAV